MSPPQLLRVLLVEDSINDTFLMVRELQRNGFEVDFERVETAHYLKAALETNAWDLVICDCCLPQFDGLSALELFRSSNLEIPFVMVSGLMNEDHALAMLRAGASEYVPKDNLARLAPAVDRALRTAAENRALKAHAAPTLRQSLPSNLTAAPAGGPAGLSEAFLARHQSTGPTPDFNPAA
jgi:DNA-binding NtrC family response regulator